MHEFEDDNWPWVSRGRNNQVFFKKKINNILIVIHLQANVRGIMPEEMGKTFRLKRNPLRAQSGRIRVLIQLHI